jgi:sRNA-binding protein
MYTHSNRHRMTIEQESSLKEGDAVSYKVGDNMTAHGEVFKILKDDQIIVQFGNGARGLEYVSRSRIVKRLT